jgi:hypothetical protein
MRRRASFSAALVALLTSCTQVDRFTDRSVGFNAQIADVQSQTLFLNIIRASLYQPLAFTSLASVTGTATTSGQLGLSLPFEWAHTSPFIASPQVSVSGGPTFTVNNLNTKEFMQGIMSPVQMQVLDLLIHEGIPAQELFYLMIGQANVTTKGHAPLTATGIRVDPIDNDPRHLADFRNFLHAMFTLGLQTEETDTITPIGPAVPAADLNRVAALAKLSEDKLDLVPGKHKTFQLVKKTTEYRFCFGNTPAQGVSFTTTGTDTAGAKQPVTVTIFADKASLCGAPDATAGKQPADQTAHKNGKKLSFTMAVAAGAERRAGTRRLPGEIDVTLRSTEGIIHYLGEITAAAICRQNATAPCEPNEGLPAIETAYGKAHNLPDLPLFTPTADRDIRHTFIALDYMGQHYALAAGGQDRSANVLSILTQLLALNSSAKDVPAASVVTLVGH